MPTIDATQTPDGRHLFSWERPEFVEWTAARFHAVYGAGWREVGARLYTGGPLVLGTGHGAMVDKMVVLCQSCFTGWPKVPPYEDTSGAWGAFLSTDGIPKHAWVFRCVDGECRGTYEDGQRSFAIVGGTMASVVCHAIVASLWWLVCDHEERL